MTQIILDERTNIVQYSHWRILPRTVSTVFCSSFTLMLKFTYNIYTIIERSDAHNDQQLPQLITTRIRICLLSLLFQGSPYSSQQLFDNCSTQLRKLQRAKLPTTDQADRASPIMAAFMPQWAVSPVRCASTSAESYRAWKHTHRCILLHCTAFARSNQETYIVSQFFATSFCLSTFQ